MTGGGAMRRVLSAGAAYFGIVFGAGFALGVVRQLWAVPAFGDRAAELLEMPIMLGVVVLAARWLVGRMAVPAAPWARLAMGALGLGLLVAAELTLVLWLRGETVGAYLAARDPVAAAAYYAVLVLFALMPWLIRQRG